jgi:hypothetical protein
MWPTEKAFDRSEKRVVFGINHTSVAAWRLSSCSTHPCNNQRLFPNSLTSTYPPCASIMSFAYYPSITFACSTIPISYPVSVSTVCNKSHLKAIGQSNVFVNCHQLIFIIPTSNSVPGSLWQLWSLFIVLCLYHSSLADIDSPRKTVLQLSLIVTCIHEPQHIKSVCFVVYTSFHIILTHR